jgi:predicted nucleic acid-binding protein
VGGAVYIDTCVIVSYVDEADPNHERAARLVEGLGGERFVSMLPLVELASVYSRAGLGEPLPLAVFG